MQSPKSLIADDDVDSQRSVACYVRKQRRCVQINFEDAEAWGRIASNPVDLIVLDDMLSYGPERDFCRDPGARPSAIPIVPHAMSKDDVRVRASELALAIILQDRSMSAKSRVISRCKARRDFTIPKWLSSISLVHG